MQALLQLFSLEKYYHIAKFHSHYLILRTTNGEKHIFKYTFSVLQQIYMKSICYTGTAICQFFFNYYSP
jgi:hypothetical protein